MFTKLELTEGEYDIIEGALSYYLDTAPRNWFWRAPTELLLARIRAAHKASVNSSDAKTPTISSLTDLV